MNKDMRRANTGRAEWYTPEPVVEAAREVMGSIDCDPASSHLANTVVKAGTFFTEEQDGLEYVWHGNVFLNPPYASGVVSRFTRTLADDHASGWVKQAIVVCNNATETGWFQYLLGTASAVCLPKSRLRFWNGTGQTSPLQGQAVMYLGHKQHEFTQVFRSFGSVLFPSCLRH